MAYDMFMADEISQILSMAYDMFMADDDMFMADKIKSNMFMTSGC